MFIGAANSILRALTRLSDMQTALQPIDMAVAFWGEGAEGLIRADRRYRLVCNLTAGGTNPQIIRELLQRSAIEMRHLPNLHAKVSVFEHGAIVSSANFSRNGLWLEGEPGGWDEAAYELSKNDPSFAEVEQWFEALFSRSLLISEEVLLKAEAAWARRMPPAQQGAESGEPCDTVTASKRSVELTEDDLFEPFIKPRNRFRMAAPWLIQVFSKIEEINNNSRYVPAYVASMIWTQSGKLLVTNIPDRRTVRQPNEVWDLALARSKSHGPRILALMEAVLKDDNTPTAVKHWAAECARMMPSPSFPPTAFRSRRTQTLGHK